MQNIKSSCILHRPYALCLLVTVACFFNACNKGEDTQDPLKVEIRLPVTNESIGGDTIQVAGDFNFRPGPVDRLKFWYRHKLHGFDDAYGFKTCVGCGRCTVSCPSGIDDIVAVVNILQSSKKSENKSDAT